MNHQLHELFRHNAWANAQVVARCKELDDAALNATTAGVYGSIFDTLWHLIGAEAGYLYRVSGLWPEYPWPRDERPTLDQLAERAALLATTWETFLSTDVDPDRLGEARGDEGEVFAVPASIFITQALHHGNEHRAQICTILGANGLGDLDVSVWEYALQTGRMTLKEQAS